MFRWIGCWCLLIHTAIPTQAGPLNLFKKNEVCFLNHNLHGKVLDFTNNHGVDRRFDAPSLDTKRDMYIYLPPGFEPTQRYPLMIWLHGFLQDEHTFLELVPLLDQSIARGELPPIIVAAPDGSIQGTPSLFNGGSFFLNSRAGRFEDYVVIDVWNFLVKNFPIRPEPGAHILAGGSMGGFAAYNLGIKYRDRFKIVAGFLPPLNLRYVDCHGRYFSRFDPDCVGFAERYRPHYPIGRFSGGVVTIRQWTIIDPLYGKDRVATLQNISRENPTEMLTTYDVKPNDLSMFIGYGGRDELNVDAQVESFLFFAAKRGIQPKVILDPRGRHRTSTGLKMIPEFCEWLKPQIAQYSPEFKLQGAMSP